VKSSKLQRQVLRHLASSDNRLNLAQAVLTFDLPANRLQEELDQMVDQGLLELDSLDDGTLYFHAPGLLEGNAPSPQLTAGSTDALAPRSPDQALVPHENPYLPATTAGRAWGTFACLSALDLFGTGLAAIIVNPAWEAEVLMWIALAGAPGTLLLLTWLIYRKLSS